MCGMCCRAIRLQISPDELKRRVCKDEYLRTISDSAKLWDSEFVYLFWEPITLEEALNINPHLKTWKEYDEAYYYTCTKFDSKTNKCSIHEKRPDVCSRYPWYDQQPFKEYNWYFYSDKCGYIDGLIPEKDYKEGSDPVEFGRRKDNNPAENEKW